MYPLGSTSYGSGTLIRAAMAGGCWRRCPPKSLNANHVRLGTRNELPPVCVRWIFDVLVMKLQLYVAPDPSLEIVFQAAPIAAAKVVPV